MADTQVHAVPGQHIADNREQISHSIAIIIHCQSIQLHTCAQPQVRAHAAPQPAPSADDQIFS